jgi:hypothetical protein
MEDGFQAVSEMLANLTINIVGSTAIDWTERFKQGIGMNSDSIKLQ